MYNEVTISINYKDLKTTYNFKDLIENDFSDFSFLSDTDIEILKESSL